MIPSEVALADDARTLLSLPTIHLGTLILKPRTVILNGGSYLSPVIVFAVFEFVLFVVCLLLFCGVDGAGGLACVGTLVGVG